MTDECPKCRASCAGDWDWSQCEGHCPVTTSPHYDPETRMHWDRTILTAAISVASLQCYSSQLTGRLRWLMTRRDGPVLQQEWRDTPGGLRWVSVPMVDESMGDTKT